MLSPCIYNVTDACPEKKGLQRDDTECGLPKTVGQNKQCFSLISV